MNEKNKESFNDKIKKLNEYIIDFNELKKYKRFYDKNDEEYFNNYFDNKIIKGKYYEEIQNLKKSTIYKKFYVKNYSLGGYSESFKYYNYIRYIKDNINYINDINFLEEFKNYIMNINIYDRNESLEFLLKFESLKFNKENLIDYDINFIYNENINKRKLKGKQPYPLGDISILVKKRFDYKKDNK